MLVDSLLLVEDHLFSNGEDTAGNGLGKSASTDDGIEVKGNIAFLQLLYDNLLAEVELVGDAFEFAQLFLGVGDVRHEHRLVVVSKGNLCGSRAGVDC